jgi:PAS domain-containing protein
MNTNLNRESRLSLPPAWHDIDSRRVLEVLLHNLEGMVFRCAIDDDWTLLFVSHGCKALTGYHAAELQDNNVLSFEELTHPQDRARIRREILAVDAGSRYRVEYKIGA